MWYLLGLWLAFLRREASRAYWRDWRKTDNWRDEGTWISSPLRSIGLCCGWEIWKNSPPCAFPSPSPLSLPLHQWGGKITALQFILWLCCFQWLETPVRGMTYIMWWKESTKIFTNSYEMQLLPWQNQAAHEWNTATPPQRLKTNSALKQFCEPNIKD